MPTLCSPDIITFLMAHLLAHISLGWEEVTGLHSIAAGGGSESVKLAQEPASFLCQEAWQHQSPRKPCVVRALPGTLELEWQNYPSGKEMTARKGLHCQQFAG